MAQKNALVIVTTLLSAIFLIGAVVFASMWFGSQNAVTLLETEKNTLVQDNQALTSQVTALETQLGTLREKAALADSILKLQEYLTASNEQAIEAVANLDDYAAQWESETAGSAQEARLEARYKEELDKLEKIIKNQNQFIKDNSETMTAVYMDDDEQIRLNNLLFTTYEDAYYKMINQ